MNTEIKQIPMEVCEKLFDSIRNASLVDAKNHDEANLRAIHFCFSSLLSFMAPIADKIDEEEFIKAIRSAFRECLRQNKEGY